MDREINSLESNELIEIEGRGLIDQIYHRIDEIEKRLEAKCETKIIELQNELHLLRHRIFLLVPYFDVNKAQRLYEEGRPIKPMC